jgi:hypothetical protein
LGNLNVRKEIDPQTQRTVAFHVHFLAWDSDRVIWMDGRPHPSANAPHTWQGFSTGVWEGNMLTVTTTHLKTNYMRRNGVPRSDKATTTEHWIRHGNYLTVIAVTNDPVFLEEPLVRSTNWYADPGQHLGLFGCEPAPELPSAAQKVPHHLIDKNPYLHEFADWYGLPYEATRGGAETLYPEYREKMKAYKAPAKCDRYCTCTTLFNCALR